VGFWQKSILTRLGYYPWECGQCREIFLLKQRFAGYAGSDQDGDVPTPLDRLLL
jgi:hypothetical protein